MEHLRVSPTPLTLYAAEHIEQFNLLDVGCSGGLDLAWRDFGDRLVAYGFDPAVAEVARLQSLETRPGVRYVPGFVVGERESAVYHHRDPSPRISYMRTHALRRGERYELPPPVQPYVARDRNLERDDQETAVRVAQKDSPRQTRLDTHQIYLPAFLERECVSDVDFVKIDVDGADFEILKSLRETFGRTRVLGAMLEVNFFGSEDNDHNTFHNTDRLMRACGFELFGLTTRPYASAALPSPYVTWFPASTVSGRPLQGDALYFRDFGWVLENADPAGYPPEKHVKLAALFAMFNLPDQAAEVLIRWRDQLAGVLDVGHALDLLARQTGVASSYSEHMAAFDAEEARFYNHEGWADESATAGASSSEHCG